MTQGMYSELKISAYPSYIASQTPAFDIVHSLFPRRSSPVVFQATVGGGEDLGMRLLSVCEMYACKREKVVL